MAEILNLAEAAALIGDPARANMLYALMGQIRLPASELAYIAGVTPQTASGHLAKLIEGRLLLVEKHGRHRYYRLASSLVGDALESLTLLAASGPPRHRPASRIDDAMRAARLCYDHMAGKLAVALADSLEAQGHLMLGEEAGEVTLAGSRFLEGFGIDLATLHGRRRPFCRLCLDWSERRLHLAGSLGAALATRCLDLGWVERLRDSRTLTVTPRGRRGLSETFGIAWDA